jgi:TIR domain
MPAWQEVVMSDVFVSYCSEDKARAALIVALLEDDGWDVFWDQDTRAGTMWPKVLEEQLEAARCVVVLWSAKSVASRWVRTEAYEALQGDKLLPLLLDEVRPPLEFRQTQTIDLTGWSGERADPRIAHLLADLSALAPVSRAPPQPAGKIEQATPDPDSKERPNPQPSVDEMRIRDRDAKRSRLSNWAIGMAGAAAITLGLAVAWQRTPEPAVVAHPGEQSDGQSLPPAGPSVPDSSSPAPAPVSVRDARAPTALPSAPAVRPQPAPPKVAAGSAAPQGDTAKSAARPVAPSRCIAIAEKYQSTGQITAAERDFLRSKECQQ